MGVNLIVLFKLLVLASTERSSHLNMSKSWCINMCLGIKKLSSWYFVISAHFIAILVWTFWISHTSQFQIIYHFIKSNGVVKILQGYNIEGVLTGKFSLQKKLCSQLRHCSAGKINVNRTGHNFKLTLQNKTDNITEVHCCA